MKETLFGAVRAKASFEVQFTHSEEREGARVKHAFSVTWKPEDAKRAEKPCLTLECVKEPLDIPVSVAHQLSHRPGAQAQLGLSAEEQNLVGRADSGVL